MKKESKRLRSQGVALLILMSLVLVGATAGGKAPANQDGRIVLAVYPIDTRQIDRRLSPSLTALVRSELVKSEKVSVIPEELFYELVNKQDLQATDYYEQRETQVQLGRMLKADKVVLGSLGRVGNDTLLILEVVDVTAGAIDKVVTVNSKEAQNDLSALALLAGKRLRNVYDPEPVAPPELPKGHVTLGEAPPLGPTPEVAIDSKPRLELKGHKYNVHSAAYSPDGRLLFTGATDTTIRVWDAADGKFLRKLTSHTETVLSLAVSLDGKRLLSGSRDDTVVMWDLETFAPLDQFRLSGDVYGVAWAPDGQRFAAAGSAVVRLYETDGGQWKLKWEQWITEALSLAYSPDGDLVAAGGEYGEIHIWKADTGQLVRKINRCKNMREVRGMTFDPFNRYLVSGSDDDLAHVWTPDGVERARLGGHLGDVNAVAPAAEGRVILTAGNDNKVKAWSADTGRPLSEVKSGRGDLLALAVRPGFSEIAVSGRDSVVRVYGLTVK